MAPVKSLFNVLLLAFILSIASGPQGSSGCTVLPNVDFPGNDIDGTCIYNIANIHGCAEKCYNAKTCVGFLWSPNSNPAFCCLKSVISSSNLTPNSGTFVVTGYGDCRNIFDRLQ